MNMPRKVIVSVTIPTIQHPDDNETVVAMVSGLPLTGLGPTADEAVENAKILFCRFIDVHRQRGTLETVLNRADVTWYWEDEYPSNQPDPEDLSHLLRSQADTASAGYNDQRTIVEFLMSQTTDYQERMSSRQTEASDLMVAA